MAIERIPETDPRFQETLAQIPRTVHPPYLLTKGERTPEDRLEEVRLYVQEAGVDPSYAWSKDGLRLLAQMIPDAVARKDKQKKR